MSTLHQLREGISHAWDNLADGWRDLSERASHALTRFSPARTPEEKAVYDERTEHRASRWGLLPAEVYVSDDTVRVELEVSGLDPENFDVQVHGDVLVVRGEKRVSRDDKRGSYYVLERAYGHFERAISLPAEVDDSKAKARYRHGVLTITLPTVGKVAKNRIPVKVA